MTETVAACAVCSAWAMNEIGHHLTPGWRLDVFHPHGHCPRALEHAPGATLPAPRPGSGSAQPGQTPPNITGSEANPEALRTRTSENETDDAWEGGLQGGGNNRTP